MSPCNHGVSYVWELMTFFTSYIGVESGSEEGLLGWFRGDVLPYLKLLSTIPPSLYVQ